jgi:hypothetical protein
MISIIICSADNLQLVQVSENIKQTIGLPFEIISFSNPGGRLGICEVYNRCINNSKYDLICFMHEDLLIKTMDWGKVVQSYFNADEQLGLIGIAGGTYKALCPSSWFSWINTANRLNLIQRYKHSIAEPKLLYNNPEDEKLSIVSAVDGVWFCTRKEIAEEIRFDEDMLKGFHSYDVDFSLSVGQKWNVAVTFEVLIEHFSEGLYDASWLASALLLHNKWNHILPVKKGVSLNKEEAKICEKQCFLFLLGKMSEFNFTKKVMYKVLWQSHLYKILGWWKFLSLHKRIYKIKTF